MSGYFIFFQFPKVILKLNKEQMSNDFRRQTLGLFALQVRVSVST